jgi:hypothetical protein
MRTTKIAIALTLVILSVSLAAVAGQNKYGVADTRKVSFNAPMKVGDVVLPKGEYQIRHTMEGENHIMVFTQLRTPEPATARVKCQLVPLEKKSSRTQVMYKYDQSDTQVLQEMTFAGDTAKHVF